MSDEQKQTGREKAVSGELAPGGALIRGDCAAATDGKMAAASGTGSEAGFGAQPVAPPLHDGQPVPDLLSAVEGEIGERYTLTHLHAKGGMGRVWLARDAILDRQIALKELRPEQADNAVVYSRFLYEAR